MRTLLKVSIPVEAGNTAVQEGRLAQVMQSLLEKLKPEAAYFVPEQGRRTALIFFDMQDPSQLVPISEPLFQGLNASLEFSPAMNAEDLRAGLQAAGIRS